VVIYCWANKGRDSAVGIATSLRAGRSGDLILAGARVTVPVQTGPGAHPASCTMGTWSLSWVKRPGRGVDHPPTSSAKVKERVELYLPLFPIWAFVTCSSVNFFGQMIGVRRV
jgi:hypothetical protein